MTGEFSKKDIKKAAELVVEEQIKYKAPSSHPKAYILGGQPGAGKTSMQNIIRLKHGDQIVIVNYNIWKIRNRRL